MNKDIVRQIINIVGVVGTLLINTLSQTIPFNGQTSAEIANRFTNNYFLPANYVFSIWSIIYIGLIAFAIFQALPRQKENPRLRAVGYWFFVSCLANCVWLFLFHYEQFWLSTIAMLVLLTSLIIIYRRLREGNPQIGAGERWAVRATFSVYLGWITVATVANFSYAIITTNPTDADSLWLGIAYQTWGAIMIAFGGLIAGVFAYLNRDLAYAAVIGWAFIGIIVRFPDVVTIAVAAGVLTAGVAVAALVSYFITNRNTPTLTPTHT